MSLFNFSKTSVSLIFCRHYSIGLVVQRKHIQMDKVVHNLKCKTNHRAFFRSALTVWKFRRDFLGKFCKQLLSYKWTYGTSSPDSSGQGIFLTTSGSRSSLRCETFCQVYFQGLSIPWVVISPERGLCQIIAQKLGTYACRKCPLWVRRPISPSLHFQV